MEGLERKQDKILFVGHLDEVDDLETHGRDAPLEDTEKNKEDLSKIVDAVVSQIKDSGRKAVMFVTSSKIRSIETAQLVGAEIKKMLGEDVKVRYATEDDLRAPEQGEFILPENYKPGSFFEGLKIASDIFYKESLDFPNQNIHYKFGDPVLSPDGSYKYPILVNYFKASGETYAESLSRILRLVIKMGQKVEKLDSAVEVIIVAHGFTYHMLRGLSVLAEKIKKENIQIRVEDVPRELSNIYESRTGELKDSMCVPIDITNLGDGEMLDMLNKEVNFLDKK